MKFNSVSRFFVVAMLLLLTGNTSYAQVHSNGEQARDNGRRIPPSYRRSDNPQVSSQANEKEKSATQRDFESLFTKILEKAAPKYGPYWSFDGSTLLLSKNQTMVCGNQIFTKMDLRLKKMHGFDLVQLLKNIPLETYPKLKKRPSDRYAVSPILQEVRSGTESACKEKNLSARRFLLAFNYIGIRIGGHNTNSYRDQHNWIDEVNQRIKASGKPSLKISEMELYKGGVTVSEGLQIQGTNDTLFFRKTHLSSFPQTEDEWLHLFANHDLVAVHYFAHGLDRNKIKRGQDQIRYLKREEERRKVRERYQKKANACGVDEIAMQSFYDDAISCNWIYPGYLCLGGDSYFMNLEAENRCGSLNESVHPGQHDFSFHYHPELNECFYDKDQVLDFLCK